MEKLTIKIDNYEFKYYYLDLSFRNLTLESWNLSSNKWPCRSVSSLIHESKWRRNSDSVASLPTFSRCSTIKASPVLFVSLFWLNQVEDISGAEPIFERMFGLGNPGRNNSSGTWKTLQKTSNLPRPSLFFSHIYDQDVTRYGTSNSHGFEYRLCLRLDRSSSCYCYGWDKRHSVLFTIT